MSGIRVKICGLTRFEDALLAAQLGAHALGFIFYPKSPRYVQPDKAKKIIENLPPFITTVGVFVNEKPEVIRQIYEFCQLNLIQLHGGESPQFCRELQLPCIKAFRIKDEDSLKEMKPYEKTVKGFLLDTYQKGMPGGTGKIFNWDLAKKARQLFETPIILAGGLNTENIKLAIKQVKPYAIDVNSGIEEAPGVKNHQLMEELFMILRQISTEE